MTGSAIAVNAGHNVGSLSGSCRSKAGTGKLQRAVKRGVIFGMVSQRPITGATASADEKPANNSCE